MLPPPRNEDGTWNLQVVATTAAIGLTLSLVALRLVMGRGKTRRTRLAEDPIPKASRHWLFGNTLEVAKKTPYIMLREKRLECNSPVFEIDIMGTPTVVVLGGDLISQLQNNEKKLHCKWLGAFEKLFGKYSILAVNGPVHQVQRRYVIDFLNGETMSRYFPIVIDSFDAELERWVAAGKKGEYVEIFSSIARLAFFMNGHFFFGSEISDEALEEMRVNMALWSTGFDAIPIDLPFTQYGKAYRGCERVRQIMWEEAERRRKSGKKENDILQRAIEAIDPTTGKPFTEVEFKHQLATDAFGALDTSVSTECEIVDLLGRRPEILKRVKAEIEAFKASREPSEEARANKLGLTYEELTKSLPFLKAVEMECNRFAAAAPMSSRHCVESFSITTQEGKTYVINEGDNVWAGLAQTVHENPKIARPEAFEPERFLPPRNEHELVENGLPYFGWGSRRCPGMRLALVQIHVLIALMATKKIHVEFRDPNVTKAYQPTLRPVGGLWVRVSKE